MFKRIICLILCCVLVLFLPACQYSKTEEQEEKGFWVRSESHFVDYTIDGDRISFRYSFCFQNRSSYDIRANAFIVSFRKRDIKRWMSYDKNLLGELENGDKDVLIPAGEKMNVILVFEGEYLGGEVNPEVYVKFITMAQRFE